MKGILKPGLRVEPRKLSVKQLPRSPQCFVSDGDDNYLWDDGRINKGDSKNVK